MNLRHFSAYFAFRRILRFAPKSYTVLNIVVLCFRDGVANTPCKCGVLPGIYSNIIQLVFFPFSVNHAKEKDRSSAPFLSFFLSCHYFAVFILCEHHNPFTKIL